MSRIKGKDTTPELIVRKFLHLKGLRYKLHDRNIPGKPDINLPKYSCLILIHGRFWYGQCGCKYILTFKKPEQIGGLIK